MPKKVIVIGSGFSSLSTACYLAKKGFDVTIFEKNATAGGRARLLNKDGFKFDLGPSWYWMPDVFESFFGDFDKKPEHYYELIRLNPAYQVYFSKYRNIEIKGDLASILDQFELREPGCKKKLTKYFKTAEEHYALAMGKMVQKPGISKWEQINKKTIANARYFFSNINKIVNSLVEDPELRMILKFPCLFLGAKPSNTPAIFSFMNHADFSLGTWFPIGGMYSVVEAIVKLSKSLDVKYHFKSPIQNITVNSKGEVSGVISNNKYYETDIIVSGADYHHTETLLEPKFRTYSEAYWKKKIFAPSALLFYIGFDRKIKNTNHHILFFDVDFDWHLRAIYDKPKWPEQPLFYANFPTFTDPSLAPKNKDLCMLLVPIAPDLKFDEAQQQRIFDQLIDRLEILLKIPIKTHILFCETYGVDDFKEDYNSYKGNAYGLATTLSQLAHSRPKLISEKVKNLFFTGQLTVPGPGVPPALISGKIVSQLIKP